MNTRHRVKLNNIINITLDDIINVLTNKPISIMTIYYKNELGHTGGFKQSIYTYTNEDIIYLLKKFEKNKEVKTALYKTIVRSKRNKLIEKYHNIIFSCIFCGNFIE